MHNKRKLFWILFLGFLIQGNGVARGQTDGAIAGWGNQIIVEPGELDDLTAVAGGGAHSLGLRSDSSVVAWGWNSYGQCRVPYPNAGFIAVAGGLLPQPRAQGRRNDRRLGEKRRGSARRSLAQRRFHRRRGRRGSQPRAQIERIDRGVGGRQPRPVRRPRAQRRFPRRRGRDVPQPRAQVRRIYRGLGRQQLRSVRRPRAQRGFHCHRVGR